MPARVFYRPGHFACRIVTYHWFYIHPRLHIEKKGTGCSLGEHFYNDRHGILRILDQKFFWREKLKCMFIVEEV